MRVPNIIKIDFKFENKKNINKFNKIKNNIDFN